ncbi:MAG: sigma-54-dependent Fis family transcriptional regulator, partial [Geobacteraceae bacterium]|nr:sigma-54-dependent Fis family transcriptional regulator [Geobacteraceae bacterium]
SASLQQEIADDADECTETVPPDSVQFAERSAILNCLKKQKWNISNASRDLCISRATLYRKMKKYSIIPPNEMDWNS